jgi:hypothetical protein
VGRAKPADYSQGDNQRGDQDDAVQAAALRSYDPLPVNREQVENADQQGDSQQDQAPLHQHLAG